MARAMLKAGALTGEYYTAMDGDELVGFTMWMPPGRDLFSTYVARYAVRSTAD